MIQYHDTLNPKIWENNSLKSDVKVKLLEIYKTFVSKLHEDNIPLEVIDVLLLGSNADFNYTDYSDIDLHIITDFDNISINNTLTQIFYNNEKTKFNTDYDITIKGIPVELYIEDINACNMTNGIYSLLQDKWIKFPEHNPPQDVDYSKLLNHYKTKISNALNSNSSEQIKEMINEIKMLRKVSLMDEGIYSKGNLVFKELRNDGSIDNLYTKLHELISDELSLENLNNLKEKINKVPLFTFEWQTGSINDNIIKYLKNKNIPWKYNGHFQLEGKIKNKWVTFVYNTDSKNITHVYINES